MNNLDISKMTKEELRSQALNAIKDGKSEEFLDTITAYFSNIADELAKKYESIAASNDAEILSKRGFSVLTSKETEFYTKLIDAMKTNSALTNVQMPETIIERVFDELEQTHELLKEIQFINVTGVTEMIVRDGEVSGSYWGDLTDAIKKELSATFKKIQVDTKKLSAYLPVAKAHLKLGPTYIDAFVRRVLAESLSIGLEDAIVNGDGNGKPIGMTRNLKGAVTEGVYPLKTAVEVTSLNVATLGKLIADLTNDGKRKVTSAIFIVNTYDYNKTILPSLYHQNADGSWTSSVPFPIKFIESCALEKGKAVIGIGKKYFMGLGSNQEITKSEDCHFLEDETVYMAKMYGIGTPLDNVSFELLDISGITVSTESV